MKIEINISEDLNFCSFEPDENLLRLIKNMPGKLILNGNEIVLTIERKKPPLRCPTEQPNLKGGVIALNAPLFNRN